jgi:hypothetical protein
MKLLKSGGGKELALAAEIDAGGGIPTPAKRKSRRKPRDGK